MLKIGTASSFFGFFNSISCLQEKLKCFRTFPACSPIEQLYGVEWRYRFRSA